MNVLKQVCFQFLKVDFIFSVLSKNGLTNVNTKAFQQLKSLSKLDLSQNRLKNVPQDIHQDLQNLLEFNLNGNQITDIKDEAFLNLPRLITL